MKPWPVGCVRGAAAGELDTVSAGSWPGSLDVWLRCILQRSSSFTLPLTSAPVAVFLRLRAAGAALSNCLKEAPDLSVRSFRFGIPSSKAWQVQPAVEHVLMPATEL